VINRGEEATKLPYTGSETKQEESIGDLLNKTEESMAGEEGRGEGGKRRGEREKRPRWSAR